jgi:WD40 repeat protein
MLFISQARVLVTSSVDGSIFVWSDKGKELQQMDFGSAVFCMAFNAKRSTLAVGGNGNIVVYRVTRPDPQVGPTVNGPRTRETAQTSAACV